MNLTVATSDAAKLLRELRAIGDPGQRQSIIAQHTSLHTADIVNALTAESLEKLRVNAAEALAISELAIDIALHVDDLRAKALAVRSKANAQYMVGRHADAVQLHDEALSLLERAGDENEIARSLSASLQPLILQGEYDRAFSAVQRARDIFQRQGNEHRLARLDINTGNIYYRQDRFAEALACYKRAYGIVVNNADREGIGVALQNLAVCLISLGDFKEALATYEHARDFCQTQQMPLLAAQANYNIAYLYFLRGEYSRAIEMLRSTRLECQQVGDRYHYALCNLDLSELYLELNLSGEAAELSRQAHEGFQDLRMKYEAAKALAFQAIAAGQQGQAFQALKAFERARAMFVEERNLVWPSLIDLYQGLVLFNEGRHFEARRVVTAALEFFQHSPLPAKAVLCRLLLAKIALRTASPAEAERECRQALESVAPLAAPMLKHQAHLLMGQIHSGAGRVDDAYASFRASREALEALRSNVHVEELKLAFVKNRLEVYELLFESCLIRSRSRESLEEALTYAEEAKSRALLDVMLQPSSSAAEAAGQSELVRRMRHLREELNWYYSLIELEQLRPEQRSPDHVQRLEAQARARESDLVQVLREVNLSEPYSPGASGRIAHVSSLRDALPADATLLEFFQCGHRIYAAVLNQELKITAVSLLPRVSTALRLLQFQLSKFRLGPEYTGAFQESLAAATNRHLATLYDELIRPIAGGIQSKHLLIVPHGSLHYVPFHALFDGEGYLADSFRVSYAPSATVYAACDRKAAVEGGATLLFGVPDSRAPHIAGEIEALEAALPQARSYIGPEASLNVLKHDGESASIIHIATHGYFRQDSPMFSSIRLGDSYLSLYDLQHLRLPAELITLSGCATGLNSVAAGDELIGLARGLLQAGAKSLLLSLWDVHDESTAALMRDFYGRLRQGEDKATALWQATLSLRQRQPHPYYWAPFVLIGSFQPLGQEK